MIRGRKQSRLKALVGSPFLAGILIVVAVFLAQAAWSIYGKYEDARSKYEEAGRQLGDLRAREAFLNEALARLSTDEGIEAEIRGKFPVVREGEEMAVIVPNESEDGENPAPESASLFVRFLRFFGRGD